MKLENYLELLKKFPYGKSRYLNLSSNFKTGLEIEHKDFCDAMINSGKFTYQAYAPEYYHRDSYLAWHEGEMELRVIDCLIERYFEDSFDKETRDRFKITIQAHSDDTTPAKKNLSFGKINKNMFSYLINFAIKNKIAFGIPSIYHNCTYEKDSVLWLPENQ